jgi:hypothetical protein
MKTAEDLNLYQMACHLAISVHTWIRLITLAVVLYLAVEMQTICRAQTLKPQEDENAVQSEAAMRTRSRYNISIGSGGLNFSAGFRTMYVDNVYLSYTNVRDDVILVPECDLAAFFPIGLSNSLACDIGLAYYDYLKNSRLNSSTPAVNPNSQLTFNLRTGDFTIGFDESFSYQVLPFYETQNQFYNLYNTAQFRRFDNLLGTTVKWDLRDLVVTAAYHHDNFWSDGGHYSYIDHASEIFNTDATLKLSRMVAAALEASGSLNNYGNNSIYNTSRARVGPALRLDVSEFITIRAGAGYERINFDSSPAGALDLGSQDTYYAYGKIDHRITQFLSQSIAGSHDNQIGFNAANLEGTHLIYSLNWQPTRTLTVSPYVSANWYNESDGPNASSRLYHEQFTFVHAGIEAARQFGRHWRGKLSWNYNSIDANITYDGYAQNIAIAEITYQF